MNSEPLTALRLAATNALADQVKPLRERGWDVQLSVRLAEPEQDHECDVLAYIRIGACMPIPDECRDA